MLGSGWANPISTLIVNVCHKRSSARDGRCTWGVNETRRADIGSWGEWEGCAGIKTLHRRQSRPWSRSRYAASIAAKIRAGVSQRRSISLIDGAHAQKSQLGSSLSGTPVRLRPVRQEVTISRVAAGHTAKSLTHILVAQRPKGARLASPHSTRIGVCTVRPNARGAQTLLALVGAQKW
jgi:hypothetical protein